MFNCLPLFSRTRTPLLLFVGHSPLTTALNHNTPVPSAADDSCFKRNRSRNEWWTTLPACSIHWVRRGCNPTKDPTCLVAIAEASPASLATSLQNSRSMLNCPNTTDPAPRQTTAIRDETYTSCSSVPNRSGGRFPVPPTFQCLSKCLCQRHLPKLDISNCNSNCGSIGIAW